MVLEVTVSLPQVLCRLSMSYKQEWDEHNHCPLTILPFARSCIDGAQYAISKSQISQNFYSFSFFRYGIHKMAGEGPPSLSQARPPMLPTKLLLLKQIVLPMLGQVLPLSKVTPLDQELHLIHQEALLADTPLFTLLVKIPPAHSGVEWLRSFFSVRTSCLVKPGGHSALPLQYEANQGKGMKL